jgi:hypothetical protein
MRDPPRWGDDPSLPSRLREDLSSAARHHEQAYSVADGLARFRGSLAAPRPIWQKPWLMGGGGGVAIVAIAAVGLLRASPAPTAPRHVAPARTPSAVMAAPVTPSEASEPVAPPALAPDPPSLPRSPSPLRRKPSAAPSEREEYMQLASVRALAARDPAAALAAAAEGDRLYPNGILRQEREAIAIDSLARIGRRDEAARRAEAFLRSYPNGPFSERMKQIVR